MEVPASLGATLSFLLSDDPFILLVQGALLSTACLLVFFVLFTTRDILHRTHSITLQICSILLVALIPLIGFFLYLLIRPRQTLEERSMQEGLEKILEIVSRPLS